MEAFLFVTSFSNSIDRSLRRTLVLNYSIQQYLHFDNALITAGDRSSG